MASVALGHSRRRRRCALAGHTRPVRSRPARRRFAVPKKWTIDEEALSDLVHEVLSVIWDEILDADSPRALFIVALNRKAIDRFRRHVRREALTAPDAEAFRRTPAQEGEASLGAGVELDQVLTYLESTSSPRDLRVFQASAMLGESSRAIAEAEGLSAANVDQIVSRTRKRLKERFDAGS